MAAAARVSSGDVASQRLQRLLRQLSPGVAAAAAVGAAKDSEGFVSERLQQTLHWNGWGFNDTQFQVNPHGLIELAGSRYLFSGQVLPELRKWMEEKTGVDISYTTPSQPKPQVPAPPLRNDDFLRAVQGAYKRISFADADRVHHAHGHTLQEIFTLRFGCFPRVPDVVVYPGCHEHVEVLVRAAHQHNVAIIPYGGGTSVSQALLCPENEKRMIVSLDMHEMNAVKWVSHKSMLACVEAGIIGRELEQKLNQYELCVGHEPDSIEFSTLGGWVATRASGMKKNRYGNIEDIVVKMRVVTPSGTIERGCQVPRISSGPDLNHLIMGSEGTLGVITEAVLRVRPAARVREYGAILFPDFECGVNCLHEIAIKRLQPASMRLVDNLQFQFSQALKPGSHDWKTKAVEKVKKWYVTQHKGFDVNKMVAATLVFEGSSPQDVRQQERAVYEIATKYGGMKAGAENGMRGFFLTYMIAYLRDFGLNYGFAGESFETSVPWENVLELCNKVKERIRIAARERGVGGTPFVSCRVTQLYDTGACVYFYFGFLWRGLKEPLRVFSEVEEEARDEILRLGGSISHHHGVGKLRKKWMSDTVSQPGLHVLAALKQAVDPRNVFAAGNLIDLSTAPPRSEAGPPAAAAPNAASH